MNLDRAARSVRFPVADVTAALASVFIALGVALAATYALVPGARPWLAESSGLLAWIKGLTFAAAVSVGIWSGRRAPADSTFRWVIPSIAIWGLADSIRYGTSVLGFGFPTIADIRVASTSDLATALSAWSGDVGVQPGLALALLAAVALAAGIARQRMLRWVVGRVMVTEYRVLRVLLAALTLTAAAIPIAMLDDSALALFSSRLTALARAALLVLAAPAAGDHRRTVAGWRGRMRA